MIEEATSGNTLLEFHIVLRSELLDPRPDSASTGLIAHKYIDIFRTPYATVLVVFVISWHVQSIFPGADTVGNHMHAL